MIYNSNRNVNVVKIFAFGNPDPSVEATEMTTLLPILPQMFYAHVRTYIISAPSSFFINVVIWKSFKFKEKLQRYRRVPIYAIIQFLLLLTSCVVTVYLSQ